MYVCDNIASLTDPRPAVFEHVDRDVVVVDAFSRRVDAGEATVLAARLISGVLARAGAAVPAVVVAFGGVLWTTRRFRVQTRYGWRVFNREREGKTLACKIKWTDRTCGQDPNSSCTHLRHTS